MHARVLINHGTAVVVGVIALVVGLIIGLLAVPAESQSGSKGGAPVTVVDSDNRDQGAAVDETGAIKVAGDVQVSGDVDVGSVEVDNFPETQDVRVTNARKDPVPVSLEAAGGRVTVNSFKLTAVPGESDEFTVEDSFQGVTMFYTSITGARNGEFITVLDDRLDGAMALRGEAGFGIGQEDHSISLTHLINVGGVRMSCPASASSNCQVEVSVTGYF